MYMEQDFAHFWLLSLIFNRALVGIIDFIDYLKVEIVLFE